MKKNKINKKACTNCGLEAAVARKVCEGCNTPFYSKRPTFFYESKEIDTTVQNSATDLISSASTVQTSNEDNSRRRTERVKREKPHFYDASEFEKKNKKKKQEKNEKKNMPGRPSKALNTQLKKKEKKKLNDMKIKESYETEDENIYEQIMTPHKAEQVAVILEELNNKLIISAWKP